MPTLTHQRRARRRGLQLQPATALVPGALRALLLILRRGLPPLCPSGHEKCSSRTAILSQVLTLYSRPIIYLYI